MPARPQLQVKLEYTDHEDSWLIVVSGEIDVSTADRLRRFVDQVVETTDGDVVVDVANVGYMDSSGLAVLLDARDALARDHRNFVLGGPSSALARLLEVCGLGEHFRTADANPERSSTT